MSGAAPPPGLGAALGALGAAARAPPAPPPLSMPIICCTRCSRRRSVKGASSTSRSAAPPGGICGRPAPDGCGREREEEGEERGGHFSGRHGWEPEPTTCGCQNGIDGKPRAKLIEEELSSKIFERPVAHFPAAARAPVARPTNAHFGVTRWVDAMRPVSVS